MSTIVKEGAFYHVASYLGIQPLGRLQCTSKQFYGIAGSDAFWTPLLKKIFANDVPDKLLEKKFLYTRVLRSSDELYEKIEAFRCRFKWGKETRFECWVPGNSNPIVLTVNFGTSHAKMQKVASPIADQTDYHLFLGNMGSLKAVPYKRNFIEGQLGRIPYRENIHSGFYISAKGNTPDSEPPSLKIREDVGYGNTLSYFSSINGWKEPFMFFCVPEDNGQSTIWTGRVPLNEEFKFVKIDPNGHITWENKPGNRRYSHVEISFS